MRSLVNFVAATVAGLMTGSLAAPVVVTPGTQEQIVITAQNTVNSSIATVIPAVASHPLTIQIENNFSGAPASYAYVTGHDINGLVIMLSPSGSWYYPNAKGSSRPVAIVDNVALPLNGFGSTTKFVLPDYISSARIYIAHGKLSFFTLESGGLNLLVEPSFANPSDPSAGVKWGFVEFTNNSGGIYANLSYVDLVGLPMGMRLTLGSGQIQTIQGLKQRALVSICNDLKAQAAIDGLPWDKMCATDAAGRALRVISPNIYMSLSPAPMESYYTDYVNKVWTKYASQDLTIDTQGAAGKVACRVKGANLTCAGDNRSYAKPTTGEILACNLGPFAVLSGDNLVHRAVVARLCAAFQRSTLLATGGNVQPSLPSSRYYLTSPQNHFSRIVHNYETDGLGYAFPYDDVNPAGQNAAGVVAGANPFLLEVAVGGFV